MNRRRPSEDISITAQEVLKFLNFSSGASDPRFLENLNKLFGSLAADKDSKTPAWQVLGQTLRDELAAVRGTCDVFREVEQAEAVLSLVFDVALPAYHEFHGDLLFHQTDESLFQPFFIGRVCETVLQQGGPWSEVDRIIPAVLRQLDDYIGHRPIAVLRTEQKIQPYDHEWVRPIPVWIRGAGVAYGPYQELIETALAILDATDPAVLFDAMFSFDQFDELAFDPRAYDFDHPANKRPNYLFGQWDMNKLDNAGLCRRFVLQQASLDAMLNRIQHRGKLPLKQVLFEEAAVLAGTILMGSGISGNRPDAHDSTVTLNSLVQRIAIYRDAFYEQMLKKLKGPHAERLRNEAVALRQPFGGARQHFNHFLARRRAEQLERVHVAQLFASIGHAEAARRQLAVVPVASARLTCEMRCRVSMAHLGVERGAIDDAASQLPQIEDLLRRAIGCGAVIDPWNILGFGGEYSLFPAIENTIHDHRVDELLDMMSGIFSLYARIHKSAAAKGDDALRQTLSENLAALAHWWDKFATIEVDSVEGISGQETLESAESVAAALRAWHEGGAAAGDIAFWRSHVEHFTSPKAYAQVVDTLLDHRDPVAAMALLVQWLSQAEEIPLIEEDYSFHDLALVWMEELWENGERQPAIATPAAGQPEKEKLPPPIPAAERWPLSKKFLDFLEANAEEYWHVPHFEMAAEALGGQGYAKGEAEAEFSENELDEDFGDEEELEDEGENLYGAAYEHVTYRDTTDDGIEGDVHEGGEGPADFELVGEAERIVSRLSFLTTVAQLWKLAATASSTTAAPNRDDVLAGWLDEATQKKKQLLDLMASVHRHRVPPPRGTHESLIEYDRRRSIKETLLEEIIQTCVETADAARMIRAAMTKPPAAVGVEEWEKRAGDILAAMLQGDVLSVRAAFPDLLRALVKQPLLYIALGRGGNPQRIVASRGRQYVLRRLLTYLPRLGLLTETSRLLTAAQLMETGHPVGPGAITEFDGIFEIGCKAITESLAISAAQWRAGKKKKKESTRPHTVSRRAAASYSSRADEELTDCVEEVVEILLHCWLNHSQGVRLSVLETVSDSARWRQLKEFIERYGNDLFTQRFMNLGNLRGILHQGVEAYLQTLHEEPEPDEQFRLLDDLGTVIPFEEAAHWLGTAIEAVVENYGEYIDYNSITTQSDRGEMLYTLLDFLRLRSSYDRLAWNLRPVLLVHQALMHCSREGAAEMWRDAVAERTAPLAQEHLKRFERLCKKYGMRLPSIANRLNERFTRPLEVDQLRALVRPAIEEMRNGQPPVALQRLEDQIAEFTKEPSGAGFELPGWLDALDRELELAQWPSTGEEEETFDPQIRLPRVLLTRAEVDRQIQEMFDDQMAWAFGGP